MSLMESLEDKSWGMLDKVGLADFFDDHYINPILFPVAIVIILAIIAFVLLTPAPEPIPEPVCGDSLCDPGEVCPEDCEPPEPGQTDISVVISGGVSCDKISIKLINSDNDDVIDSAESGSRVITFSDVTAENVHAEVSSPDSSRSATKSVSINTAEDDNLRVELLEDYCGDSVATGNILVKITDREGAAIEASVSLFKSGGSRLDQKDIDGEGTFRELDDDTWYYVTASAVGFNDFDGSLKSVYVKKGETVEIIITLSPYSGPTKGDLEVCLDADALEGAKISVYDLSGEIVTSAELTEECITFGLDAGRQYYIAVTQPPEGCAVSTRMGPYTIEGGLKINRTVILDCDLTGQVAVVVYGNNSKLLTENITIDLYYENRTFIKSLLVEEDITEFVSLPDGSRVYAFVFNVPEGYLDTESVITTIEDGVNATIVVTLNTPGVLMHNLTIHDIDISHQVLNQGQEFTAVLSSVRKLQEIVTEDDGVSVECETSWGQHVAAVYDGVWTCALIAPNEAGEEQLTVTASQEGATPDTVLVDLIVAETDIFPLEVEPEEFNTGSSPLSMSFKITRDNEGTTENIGSLYNSSVILVFTESNGVASKTSLTGNNGIFETNPKVPFSGYYDYTANARAFIDGFWYVGLKQGRVQVLTGTPGALDCEIEPRIVAPGDGVVVTATLEIDGTAIGDQELVVRVDEGLTESIYTLIWNEENGTYTQNILASSKECAYSVTCYPLADFDVAEEETLYVANPFAQDINELDCPVNPLSCGTLNDVRSCYKFLTSAEVYSSSDMSIVLTCAENGLTSCESQLACGEDPGDMNGDGGVDSSDQSIWEEVFIAHQADEQVYYDEWPPECADVNEDDVLTEEDGECLYAKATGLDETLYCMSCQDAIGELGRLNPLDPTLEICHDGLDNNCDGINEEDDPNCVCNADTPCNIRWDDDGVYNPGDITNDLVGLSRCRSYGKTAFVNMDTSWEEYGWKDEEALQAHDCSSRGREAWGETERCSTEENWVSCLWKFKDDFSILDDRSQSYGGAYFGSVGEVANAGPLGVLQNCASCKSCPSGWVEVGRSNSGVCGCGVGGGSDCDVDADPLACQQYDENNYQDPGENSDSFDDGLTYAVTGPNEDGKLSAREDTDDVQCDPETENCVSYSCSSYCFTYCRFGNDPCIRYDGGSVECGPSGGARQTEACSNKIQCMGTIDDF